MATKTLIDGKVIPLLANEIGVTIEEISTSLNQQPTEVELMLDKLCELDLTRVSLNGDTRLITLQMLSTPTSIINVRRNKYLEDKQAIHNATGLRELSQDVPVERENQLATQSVLNTISESHCDRAFRETGARGGDAVNENAFASGQVPQTKEEASITTVRDFSKDYLRYVETNFAVKTYEIAERVMELFNAMFGDRILESLTLEDLEKFKTARKEKDVSNTTINMDTKTLKAALSVAVNWRRINSNPFAKAKPMTTNQHKPAYLTHDEFNRLMQAIDHPWLLDIVKFSVLTGARLGEIMNLKWSDYDTQKKEVTLVSSEHYRVKGGKMRILPLSPDAANVLDGKTHNSEWVFVNERGEKYTSDYVSKLFKAYVRKAGLPEEIHFHSMRHTFCTWAGEANMPSHVLKAYAGHSSIRTTEGYLGTNREVLRAEVAKVKLPTVE